jgi:tripartite ATP-independent transporter DctM subunit
MISLFLIALFTGLMLAGLPVAASLLLASIVAMLAGGHDLMGIPQHMAASVRSLELMAIPFFILAAQLMTELGMTRRIFAFAEAAVGWMRGGLAHANVVAGFIFSGISGAAVADAAALGAISMREMPRAGYAPPFAAAVVMSVSTLGPIIPPSIMMVVYAIAANVSIARMFIAGLVPGLVIALAISLLVAIHARLGLTPIPDRTRFDWRRLAAATRSAALALFAPVVILRGMSTGMVTPTEAGVLACFYAMLVGALTGTLRWRALFNAFRDTAVSSAHILFIIAASSALSYVVIAEGTAANLAQWLADASVGKTAFLLLANAMLLVLGCLIETLPAMLIATPLLLPTAKTLGIDLVHLGVVIIFNLLIGIMTPPMGIGLYILAAISRLRIGELAIAAIPFVGVLLAVLMLLTFVPELTLWLPDLLFPDPAATRKTG